MNNLQKTQDAKEGAGEYRGVVSAEYGVVKFHPQRGIFEVDKAEL